MKINSYKYIAPNNFGRVASLIRDNYMTPQYIQLVSEYLSTITLTGKTAFLYAAGVVLSAAETRNVVDTGKYDLSQNSSTLCIKEITAFSMHKWIGNIKGKENIKYANINGNTCASSMFSLYEASKLLEDGFDEVIIVSEEKTSFNTLRVFDEHRIDLQLGEGLAIIHLGKGDQITDCKWSYEYNTNPFGVTSEGYCDVFTKCDYVNPHGTGTTINERAESFVYGNIEQIRFKEYTGHTQGVSGLLEICMLLDSDYTGKILCVSSGLGGFYGSCILHL